MCATAVIPIKDLRNAKRRLSARLWPDERARLVLRLLNRELRVLNSTPGIQRVVVVTADPLVRELSESKGAVVALEPDRGVNAAMSVGIQAALDAGAGVVTAIHGDLPLIDVPDIEDMLVAARSADFAIAPDRNGTGTNAIAMRSDVDVNLHFGPGSFQRFIAAARENSLSARIVSSVGLGLDLDTPADLNTYRLYVRQCLTSTIGEE